MEGEEGNMITKHYKKEEEEKKTKQPQIPKAKGIRNLFWKLGEKEKEVL